MEGFLNIDKPSGLTSHDVVNRVRRAAGLRRVGHAGTLDPLATGVLIVGLGRATRLLEYVVGQPKAYLATARLGQTTTTYDADGALLEIRPVTVGRADMEAALAPLRGAIAQTPPMYSAVKQAGQPLYALARQGIAVQRAPRQVMIYRLELGEQRGAEVMLWIDCSAGAYVRSLVHDWGQTLGCGAHVTALRRLRVGEFSAESALPLDQLTPDNLARYRLPLDAAIRHLPALTVDAHAAHALRLGQPIPASEEQPAGPLARAYSPAGDFIGVLTGQAGRWQPHKIFWPDADVA